MFVNGVRREVPAEWRDESLLSFVRDRLGLTGTKFGCGKGVCGACAVHLDGSVAWACVVPVGSVLGSSVTTIEGLATAGALHPVQQAWKECSVPQCGYCQPGQIMTAAALLQRIPDPSAEDVASAMSGNLCRCGTYPRIRKGVLRAAEIARGAV